MATTEEAWEAVQDNLRKLADAIGRFRTVEIATTVSDFTVVDDQSDTSPMPIIQLGVAGSPARGLVTRIDMLQGDVLHNRSPDLDDEEAARLKEIHDKHVALGQQIFQDNITFIVETVKKHRE